MDKRLVDGGLALTGHHEVAPSTSTLIDDAAATLFAVGHSRVTSSTMLRMRNRRPWPCDRPRNLS